MICGAAILTFADGTNIRSYRAVYFSFTIRYNISRAFTFHRRSSVNSSDISKSLFIRKEITAGRAGNTLPLESDNTY